jgi:Bacterial Ig-like domain (group 2)./Bacterial pre-peptidase C-terminal domain.
MTHRNVVRFFSGALLAALVYGCGDNTPTSGPSTGLLEIDPPYAGFLTGETVQLRAMLNGVPVSNVTWQTSDASIATVSSTGLVTGVGNGRVAISATMVDDASRMRSASMTVTQPPTLVKGVEQKWTGVTSGTLARDQGLTYRFIVPAGMTSLTVTFTGGTGDGDIYVQKDTPSNDPANFGNESPGCHSWNAANAESCTVTNPAAGTWFVFIAVWDPYADATLTATGN